MFWYAVLFVVTIIFALIAMAAFVLFVFSGCDVGGLLLICVFAGLIFIGGAFGTTAIEEANTFTTYEIIEMQVVKCDISSTRTNGTAVRTHCHISVSNADYEGVLEISQSEYAKTNVGDTVNVKIITTTRFGNERKNMEYVDKELIK